MASKINIYHMDYSKCTNCHKCMRMCGVKAIKVVGGRVQIMNKYCIGCGQCMEICPQNTRTHRSDIDAVKEMIRNGEQVYLSVDPSYPGIFDYDDPRKLVGALFSLGFTQVRETAEGAEYVTTQYADLLQEGSMENIITTSCPSVVDLIEKHYPEVLDCMAPVVSPVAAHAKLIKKVKGAHVKVVYAGPCLSRSVEKLHFSEDIDGVIDFREIEQWFAEKGITIADSTPRDFDNPDPMIDRLYAVDSGILRCIEAKKINDGYQKISVSGIKNCREFLHSMKKGYVHKTFAELNVCPGGCVNGPCIDKNRGFRFRATLDLERSVQKKNPPIRHEMTKEELTTAFAAHPLYDINPTEDEISAMLEIIGNIAHTTNLDCGACGYETCREKAIAMYRDNAERTMCLMYSYEKARSMSNLVLQNTPNIIIVIDAQLHILEFNQKAEEVFKTSKNRALDCYLFDFMDSKDFEEALLHKQSSVRVRKVWKDLNMTVLQTIIYIAETGCLMTIIEDVTQEEAEKEKMMNKRLHTIEVAQNVIDKQMMTAQQIAGLLGETTAETKAILYKMRDDLLEDDV